MSPKGWINIAEPGDVFVYYEGNLMEDRDAGRRQDEIALADFFWQRYEAGQVDLLQERVGPNSFRYMAIKRTGA